MRSFSRVYMFASVCWNVLSMCKCVNIIQKVEEVKTLGRLEMPRELTAELGFDELGVPLCNTACFFLQRTYHHDPVCARSWYIYTHRYSCCITCIHTYMHLFISEHIYRPWICALLYLFCKIR